ncbi:MAG: hypothetical protein ABI729_03820 [Chitinophagales bacterium]
MKNTETEKVKVLLIGIGNSGRSDDGLGWMFAEMASRFSQIDVEFRYQLQIEDAELVCKYDTVFFADACHTALPNGFEMKRIKAARHFFYSSHLQSPETILYLAKELYTKSPVAYTIAIEGLHWELGTVVSDEANIHLQSAFSYFRKKLIRIFNSGLAQHQRCD